MCLSLTLGLAEGHWRFSCNISCFALRVDSSGRRVASLDVDGVIKVCQHQTHPLYFEVTRVNNETFAVSLNFLSIFQVWSLPNHLIQTKATIMSKSPLLSLEWATKPDRLVWSRQTHRRSSVWPLWLICLLNTCYWSAVTGQRRRHGATVRHRCQEESLWDEHWWNASTVIRGVFFSPRASKQT